MHWVDGVRAESLPLPDRGLNFGDGLFETLLFTQQGLVYQDLHLSRLQAGITALGMPDCLDYVRQQLALVSSHLCEEQYTHCAVRATVTRGGGPRGYAPVSGCSARIIISASVMDSHYPVEQAPAALGVAKTPWSYQPQLVGIKHLNRLDQVLAARERLDAGVDEMIMLDDRSSVVSTISGNLFLVEKGALVTPRLDRCGINGTRRRLILDRWCKKIGVEAREAQVSVEQLENASELFYCNALTGVRPVGRLGSKEWTQFPICKALHQAYCGENQ